MKVLIAFLAFQIALSGLLYAQHESVKGNEIICYASDLSHQTYIPAPPQFLKHFHDRSRIQANSTFEVAYNDFEGAAKEAFQFAVDIWASIIISDVPIRINAIWTQLAENILGSAGPTAREKNFDGAPMQHVLYPIALAERLAGKHLNEPDEFEMNVRFNNDFTWNFGTDGNTPDDVHDFVTVALHEIAHGLGISDSYDVDGINGTYGEFGQPNIYDYFMITGDGTSLIDTDAFDNPSSELKSALTSGNIFFNSSIVRLTNQGENSQIYAPSEWNDGSSMSHLDEQTYPPGNIHSMMTPQIGRSEAVHDPGHILLSMMAELGYVWTYVNHVPVDDTPNLFDPVTINMSIKSDSSINLGDSFLFYSFDEFASQQSVPINKVSGDNYQAIIPGPGFETFVDYYISVKDGTQRSYTSPTDFSEGYYRFGVGLVTRIEDYVSDSRDLKIFPNPSNGVISLSTRFLKPVAKLSVTVTNLLGATVYRQLWDNPGLFFETQIQFSGQPGMYLVQINMDQHQVTKRLVLQ